MTYKVKASTKEDVAMMANTIHNFGLHVSTASRMEPEKYAGLWFAACVATMGTSWSTGGGKPNHQVRLMNSPRQLIAAIRSDIDKANNTPF